MRERIRSLVCKNRKHTSVVATVAPDTSGVPHAMVGTACFAKTPGERALGNHRWRGLPCRRPPSVRGENIGAASWRKAMRRDIALWAVRERRCRHHHRRASLPGKPGIVARVTAIGHRSRPPHPTPRIVTIAKRPSCTGRDGKEYSPKTRDVNKVGLYNTKKVIDFACAFR